MEPDLVEFISVRQPPPGSIAYAKRKGGNLFWHLAEGLGERNHLEYWRAGLGN